MSLQHVVQPSLSKLYLTQQLSILLTSVKKTRIRMASACVTSDSVPAFQSKICERKSSTGSSDENKTRTWKTENYLQQRKVWPKEGKHILAQYDKDSIVVYQAFCPEIAEYAVKNQEFGGPAFSFQRMSWIKTNFLWMMYRCGWAAKRNQERVLAVRITRSGFEEILANAYSAKLQKDEGLRKEQIKVRLQWDPDHTPTFEREERKAIQLGLKEDILQKYATEWILDIKDITPFVKEQKKNIETDDLEIASERVYPLANQNTCSRIGLDVYEQL